MANIIKIKERTFRALVLCTTKINFLFIGLLSLESF